MVQSISSSAIDCVITQRSSLQTQMMNEIRPPRLVCLTGFMGCGKSTAAALLARQVGWPCVDLDKRITDATGLEIPEIFSRMGEPEFRRIEHEQLVRAIGESVEQQKPPHPFAWRWHHCATAKSGASP